MSTDGAGPPEFSLEVSAEDAWTKVAVAGELDLATAEDFSSAVCERLASGAVLIDLRQVTFMDSAGIRALNTALRAAAENGKPLRIADDMQPAVIQLLEMTGMLGLLPVGDGQ